MTLLPIAARELRVAARKRSTFWLRIIAALVAFVLGCGFLALSVMGVGAGFMNVGKGLFTTLAWLCLAAALSAGLFLTSDCLSEEKREGTLGFLFLTDLRGFDVVLGKLLATSLCGAYALLAVLPVLALTLVMGGVSGTEFWRSALALLNALFLSLAAGMFVSAISRDSQKALAATFLVLLLLVVGGPAADATAASVAQRPFAPCFSLASAGYLLVLAGGFGRSPFWPTLFVNQAIAWTFLLLACWLLPRVWQERGKARSSRATGWAYDWKFGGVKRRLALRRKLIELNPVVWLACRERWQTFSVWLVLLAISGVVSVIFLRSGPTAFWPAWTLFGGLLTLMMYLGVASQSVRFFVEARRSGLLELLLSTPLPARAIVQGQWRALLRMFGAPLTVCLVLQIFGTVQSQRMMLGQVAVIAPVVVATNSTTINAPSTTFTVTNGITTTTVVLPAGTTPAGFFFSSSQRDLMLAVSILGILAQIANLVAIVWFGMWMGLNSRTTNLATLKTMLFVQIIPWFVVSFLSAMAIPLVMMLTMYKGRPTGGTQLMEWFPVITSGLAIVMHLGKDIGFIRWSRKKLGEQFREHALRAVAPIRPPLPPPLPLSSVPPIVATR
ncbi:MAG: ABC transporter permease subunit [Verrucomicrobia bacterium]|nr:ABC transporter permease subunit [Verrucomicrobiota bacterium]